VLHDLTERRQAEEERLRLATAVEHAAEGIVIVETGGTVRYVNPAFESVSGYAREDIDGQNFRVLDHTGYKEDFYQTIWQNLSSGQVWSGHIVNKKKSGKTCELKMTISPIRNHSDEIISFVAMIRDVTLEVRMEKQILQSQKMEAIGTLAGGIAHDFNNILSAIMGYTELSLNELHQESTIRSRMEKVMKACHRAADLVKQILAFSRRSEKEMKPVNMVSIVNETVRLLRASLPATIEIRRKFNSRSGMILGDPTQIHQVLMNLCTNAAHAMEVRGGILGISLTDAKNDSSGRFRYKNLAPGPYVKLTVTDTGHGMDRALIERIFEPFFTTKCSGKGTGMGLAVTHGIVEAHKGMITVYSEPGKGTTFHVLFPELTASVSVSANAEPAVEEDTVPTGTGRILFVDDEESLTESGCELLESLGYSVTATMNSVEALDLFIADPDAFDLVITDQTMPRMTGLELSEELLAVRPDIPIILCSGFSEAITPEKLRKIGIRRMISKPFVKQEMAQCIRSILRSEE
jgi:PAS domain S-box-containing protein